MTQKSPSSDFTPERWQYRTATGRQCCSTVIGPDSSFCTRHAPSEHDDSEDFSVPLTERACRFQNAQGINHSLGALYTLVAQGRISPRRASVLAYISSLLIRSLTAIDNDRFPKAGRPGYSPYDQRTAPTDVASPGDVEQPESQAPAATAATAEQRIPPGKDPLPATAEEFVDAVLKRGKPN